MYKILFVDDEQNILQYLPIAIDWQNLGIHEMRTASNGREALKIIEEFKPDIAIIDVEMPGMDGLELSRKAIPILPDLKIVILSAFDRFDYAKRAISAGVCGYILKPVDEQELETVIRKVLQEIVQTTDKSQSLEKLTLKALEKEMKELAEHFIRQEIYNIDLDKEFPALREYRNGAIVIQDKEDSAFPSTQLTMLDESDEVVIPLDQGEWVVLWNSSDNLSISSQIKGDLRFFYTRKQEGENTTQSMMRCFQALEYAFYTNEYHIDAKSVFKNFKCIELHMPDLSEALNLLSEEADISVLEALIREEVEKAFDQQVSPVIICQMVFDTFITLKIYLTKCWQDEALKIFRKMNVWSFLRCGSQENLYKLISKNLSELQAFVVLQKETHGNFYIVKVAKRYTKEHFEKTDLSLQEVADAVGISRTYFSSIFKELTGEKYWDYLTKYRIEQAKSLLKDTNMPQSEICEKIGYSSEYHFSRKFKEVVGVSPNKFRKQ